MQPTSERQPLKNEPGKGEEKVEVIKVSHVHQDAACSNNSYDVKVRQFKCKLSSPVLLSQQTGLHKSIAQVYDLRCCDSKCVFVFQVYLEAQKKEQDRNRQSLKMLSDEVSQIQEVCKTAMADHMFSWCMFILRGGV